jgi:hypothetical protein
MRPCRRHQASDPTCPTCAGRYARRTARSILATNPRRLFSVEFSTNLSLGEFDGWRRAARNLIDHQRRECRWWRDVSMQVWLGADGQVRGVVGLDAITPEEFGDAFRRWYVCLNEIGAADLSEAIYAAVDPGVVASSGEQGGYQAVKFQLKAQAARTRAMTGPPSRPAQIAPPAALIEPMPILF